MITFRIRSFGNFLGKKNFQIFENFSKCQTWVTSHREILGSKIFFADFHELNNVDSKNEKKKFFLEKKFFGSFKSAIFEILAISRLDF